MIRKKTLFFVLLVFVLCLQNWSGVRPAGADERERILGQLIFQGLKQWHYAGRELDAAFSSQAFNQFLKTLDYGKAFLIAVDLQELEKHRFTMLESLQSGRYPLVDLAAGIMARRIVQVQEMCRDILSKPFDFFLQESIELDSEKREYCRDERELKDYWRRRLKYLTLIRYHDALGPGRTKAADQVTQIKKADASVEKESRQAVLKSISGNLNRLTQNLNRQEVLSRLFNSFTAAADPHSVYLPPKRRDDFEIEMSGSLEGIGALLGEENGFVKVVEIVPGGPAWKQKELEVEDLILKAGQQGEEAVDLIDMALSDAVKLIRGKKGTVVRLTVRKPDGRIAVIPITRDVVVLQETFARGAVITHEDLDINIGYIYLPRFYHDFNQREGRNATSDVKKIVSSFAARGVDAVVLDLRGNRGGTLDDAVRIAGLFLPGGAVVQVKGRGRPSRPIIDEDKGVAWAGPLAVMINPLSASASEIVAAALQDYGRALIIAGPRSFGKGTVQAMLNLDAYLQEEADRFSEPLGALTLTVQQFFRVSGEAIQAKGVVPDLVLPDPYGHLEIGERYLDNSLPWDSLPALDITPLADLKGVLPALQGKSRSRLTGNDYFQTLSKNTERLQRMREQTVYSLHLPTFISAQQNLREEATRHDLDGKGKPRLKARDPEKNPGNSTEDPYAEWKKNWLEDLCKDPFLEEVARIMADFLG